ncbi:MAG: hypothetical protein NZM09_12130 [Ignavibacterium sp.]|nr:hypothetical protein [Ignavibacterium sp.]MDW8376423.1 hypothetical protein [Ignavibacteriales bacterium]
MPNKTIDAVIIMGNNLTTRYRVDPVDISPFEYGAGNDADSIIFANTVKIKFSLTNEIVPTTKKFFEIISLAMVSETSVYLYENGNPIFFKGNVDKKDFDFDFDRKTVSISLSNPLLELKNINPRLLNPNEIAEPYPYIGNLKCATFEKVITKTIKLVWAEFGNTFIYSDIKADTDYPFLGQSWQAPAQYFGDVANRFWGSDSKFTNCLDLIKAIGNTLGCVGLLIGKNYYLMPRYFNINRPVIPLENISKIQLKQGVKTIKGLKVNVKLAGGTYVANYGNVANSDYIEEIDMMHAGGNIPGTNQAYYLPVLIPGFVAGIGNEQWVPVSNKFYTQLVPYPRALWSMIGESIWRGIENRYIYNVEMFGINYSYGNYYKLPDNPTIFKARKIKYDYKNQKTTMELTNVIDYVEPYSPSIIMPGTGWETSEEIIGETID